MSLPIPLSADEEKRLAERDFQAPARSGQALAPFRRQVEESGLSDDDLGNFFEEVRDEVCREKLGRSRDREVPR